MENKDTYALEIMSELRNYNKFVQTLMKEHIRKGLVLDFGCGFGDFAKHLNDLGWECDGVEVAQKANLDSQKKGIKTFNSLSEVKKLYQVVVSLNVLEHIEDDVKILKNLFDLIEKEGSLVLYLLASNTVWSNMDTEVGHIRRYSKKEINEKLHTVGFTVSHSSYKDFGGWLILLIFKLFRIQPKFNIKLLMFYDKFIFPFIKYADIVGSPFIGKNLLIVAKVLK